MRISLLVLFAGLCAVALTQSPPPVEEEHASHEGPHEDSKEETKEGGRFGWISNKYNQMKNKVGNMIDRLDNATDIDERIAGKFNQAKTGANNFWQKLRGDTQEKIDGIAEMIARIHDGMANVQGKVDEDIADIKAALNKILIKLHEEPVTEAPKPPTEAPKEDSWYNKIVG